MDRGIAPRTRQEDGFTIVELLVAVTILLVGILGAFKMVDAAGSTTRSTLGREGATTLTREVLERSRQLPYATLAAVAPATTAAGQIQALLDDSAATKTLSTTSFLVTRRDNVAYTVSVTACKVDGPSDGVGVHGTSFCDFGTTAPTGSNPGAGVGSAPVTLKLLGIAVAPSGTLLDQACSLLGTNPLGLVPGLDAALGRGVAGAGLLGLLGSGAQLRVCGSGTASQQSIVLDDDPDDLTRVTVRTTWAGSSDGVRQVTYIPDAS